MISISMKKLVTIPLIALVLGVGLVFLSGAPAMALDIFGGACSNQPDNPVCDASGDDDILTLISNIINTLLFLIGIAAVVVIIIGGFRYVAANGDTGAMATAKNTILYAVVGLVVAIASFAIVNFVLERF